MKYSHISYEQRVQIYTLLSTGFAKTQIARQIGVHKSTISREVKRNRGHRGYRYKQAQELAMRRRQQSPKHIHFTDELKKMAEPLIKQEWSPEQIAGHLEREHAIKISHETIYQWLWADKRAGGDLYTHLRHGKKKRRKRYGKNDARGQIKDRVSIDQRPAMVAQKERLGDWEIDTMIGAKHQGVLVTAVERKTQWTRIKKIRNKEAKLVADTIVKMLGPYRDHVHTITIDNGKEFANHRSIAKRLEAAVYFAHPYHSWERGLNEQINGLIRQYFPKKMDFTPLTKTDTEFVEKRLNNRPRKLLNFQSPNKIFLNQIVALGT